MEIPQSKTYGIQQDSSKKEAYSKTSLAHKARKISNEQSNLTPQGTRKRRTNKAQSQ